VKFLCFLALTIMPELLLAAGPQGHAQIYDLQGNRKGQVVMLSNWPDGRRLAIYEESPASARRYFSRARPVWIWCDGKSNRNRVKKIDLDGSGWTTIDLAVTPACNSKPLLMSNYQFPKQRWSAAEGSETDVRAIRKKLKTEEKLRVTKITSEQKGTFYLVFDPRISSSYDSGGYRFLDGHLNQISIFEGAPLSPLVDLNNDSVPEFFFPSSDGLDAWIYQMFPKLDTENSQHDEFIRQKQKEMGTRTE